MSDAPRVTVNPDQLKLTAGINVKAAEEAGKAVAATENADLEGINGKLMHTHGPISGVSNDAIVAKAHEREEAGRALAQRCLDQAQHLTKAAALYTATDSTSAENLNNHMRS
jgi:hypothetical protein